MTSQDSGTKKPDEIMAEYLLRGGKMLEKTCRTCGCPLFEYKGETLCVVCAEEGKRKGKEAEQAGAPGSSGSTTAQEPTAAPDVATTTPLSPGSAGLAAEIERTIAHLSARVRAEPDPGNCLILMDCVARGVEALRTLRQR
jgi:UPF0148 protein